MMMYADDIVVCGMSTEQVEENLNWWRYLLEERGMKASHGKTEYMCANEREASGTARLKGVEVKRYMSFITCGLQVKATGSWVKR